MCEWRRRRADARNELVGLDLLLPALAMIKAAAAKAKAGWETAEASAKVATRRLSLGSEVSAAAAAAAAAAKAPRAFVRDAASAQRLPRLQGERAGPPHLLRSAVCNLRGGCAVNGSGAIPHA
eukprot:COSAG06_NODE_1706_length_8644_cov_2.160679_5_plen_123_part_00